MHTGYINLFFLAVASSCWIKSNRLHSTQYNYQTKTDIFRSFLWHSDVMEDSSTTLHIYLMKHYGFNGFDLMGGLDFYWIWMNGFLDGL